MNKPRVDAAGSRRWPMLLTAMALLVGCGDRAEEVRGFVLPEGDIDAGKSSFADYGCLSCHVVADIDIEYLGEDVVPRIQLGGEVRKVKSYGDLLTSIVNPNHTLANQYLKSLPQEDRKKASSPMPDFNEQLTVADLIDMIEFLHSRYEETVPEYVGRRYVR